jgi:hypothetical protein
MVYVSRKIIYPMFVLVFAIAFFMLIYLVSFSSDLTISNAQFDFSGDKIVLKMDINNGSNHYIRDIEVIVISGNEEKNHLIEQLEPKEQYKFEEEYDLSESLTYRVYVKAPFNVTKQFDIELDETTVRPVLASISMAPQMKVGQEYNPILTFKNVSQSDISKIIWITSSEGDYFEDDFFPREFALKSGESKSLPVSFTPKAPGIVKLTFILKVGNIEYEQEHIVTITSE